MRLPVLLTALVVLSLASSAAAQSDAELAEARRLFSEGLAAAEEHRWDEARASFEASLAITERPSTLLNLAAAQAETGAVLASVASYRRFLEIATGRDARHRDAAEEALAAVERRIAYLEIDTTQLLPGDAVELDEQTLLPSTLAEPIALDPGEHRLAVLRRSVVVFEQSVTLGDGARQSLTLDVGVAEPEPEPEPVVLETPATAEASGGNDDGVWIGIGVTAGVLVVAGVVIGVVFATLPTQSGEPYMGNVGDGMIRF